MVKKHFLIVEALLKQEEGLTRQEINQMLETEGESYLPRLSFIKAINSITSKTGIRIISRDCGKNIWRYRIDRSALEDYDREQLLGNLLANMMQADFLLEFRDLGSKIQPLIIPRGTEHLRTIGTALRGNRKLQVTYRKFENEPKEAVIHPYCLKVFGGRWYLFAYKENSSHADVKMQCFALDRFLDIVVMKECFTPDSTIDPQEYFRDSFGIWVDTVNYPVEDIIVACTPRVANYLRSLPLHHSQRELDLEPSADNPFLTNHFSYHISVTPDFVGEINKWGGEAKMVQKG